MLPALRNIFQLTDILKIAIFSAHSRGLWLLRVRVTATDRAVTLGLHGYSAEDLSGQDVDALVMRIWENQSITVGGTHTILYCRHETNRAGDVRKI